MNYTITNSMMLAKGGYVTDVQCPSKVPI